MFMRRRANKVSRAFGALLRAQRERSGLTQEQLSLRASADRIFIWRRTQPSLALLISLAEVMGVDTAELVAETVARMSPARNQRSNTHDKEAGQLSMYELLRR